MRILVVEDEKINRLYISNVTKIYGQSDIAEDGAIAIEKIKKAFEDEEPYDVVFLDIMMPKISGHIVLQMLRAYELDFGVTKENRTKVFMTSSFRDSDNIKQAYDKLVDGYLVKPILKEKIEEIFKKLID